MSELIMTKKDFVELMKAWEELDERCPKCGCSESGWEYHDCYGTSADELAERQQQENSNETK